MAHSYVTTQATIAAAVNIVVNPVLAWVLTGDRSFLPVEVVMVNVLITSVILSTLVALFVGLGARRELSAGHQIPGVGHPLERRLLLHMPTRPWLFGLLVGAGAGVVMVLVLLLLSGWGLTGLSFSTYLLFLVVYTGTLAFVVARAAILRQTAQRVPG